MSKTENSVEDAHQSAGRAILPKPEGRFNNWGERKWIAVPPEKQNAVAKECSDLRPSYRARALYQTARFTDSRGVEFTFISNAQFPDAVHFRQSGIRIVPCFIPFSPMERIAGDKRQMAMQRTGQFIYDGWIPNDEWTHDKLEQIVSMLDNLVNLFSIVGRYYAYWEPKYYFNEPVPFHLILPRDFVSLAKAIETVEQLPEKDRIAIDRSAAWIADALRTKHQVQRFLLLFVSIESLATHIERQSSKDSPLRSFAADKLPRPIRKQERERCIQEIMASDLKLTQAVQRAYFECVVGSRKMLEEHLNRVFGNNEASKVLFASQVGGKTLWNLRNDIAHGSLNLLNEEEVRFVSRCIGDLETIARQYLQRVLVSMAQIDHFPKPRRPGFAISMSDAIGGPDTQYMGPTDMAEHYANVRVLSSTYITVGFR